MNRPLRAALPALALGVLVLDLLSGAWACRSRSGRAETEGPSWKVIDVETEPANDLEELIQADYDEKGLLPLRIRNHGPSPEALRRFRGAKLVGASVSVLEMTFPGTDDWAVVEIWIQGEEGREIRRTILYVLSAGEWRVADSGRLAE